MAKLRAVLNIPDLGIQLHALVANRIHEVLEMGGFSAGDPEGGDENGKNSEAEGCVRRDDGYFPYHTEENSGKRDCRFLRVIEGARGPACCLSGTSNSNPCGLLLPGLRFQLLPTFAHRGEGLPVGSIARKVVAFEGIPAEVVEFLHPGLGGQPVDVFPALTPHRLGFREPVGDEVMFIEEIAPPFN